MKAYKSPLELATFLDEKPKESIEDYKKRNNLKTTPKYMTPQQAYDKMMHSGKSVRYWTGRPNEFDVAHWKGKKELQQERIQNQRKEQTQRQEKFKRQSWDELGNNTTRVDFDSNYGKPPKPPKKNNSPLEGGNNENETPKSPFNTNKNNIFNKITSFFGVGGD